MRFLEGAPILAVEVRSENDYTPSAEIGLAANRADYFEPGTAIVWDVDPIAECIHIHRAETPDQPVTFGRGRVVNAEPPLPGWRVAVDWIFA